MEKVITVVINHQAFNDGTTQSYEVDHPQITSFIENDGYKVKDVIPLTNLQDTNAGISVITFILEPVVP